MELWELRKRKWRRQQLQKITWLGQPEKKRLRNQQLSDRRLGLKRNKIPKLLKEERRRKPKKLKAPLQMTNQWQLTTRPRKALKRPQASEVSKKSKIRDPSRTKRQSRR